ncbi:MAG: S-methyl-5'-thioinosine phosphorylase [Acidiferrobacterales bacterium]
MTVIAIIGGSGLTQLENLQISNREAIHTPYGDPSSEMVFGNLKGREVIFLPRHGVEHTIPPHAINYRANIWAIKQTGATHIIAVNAVGAIADLEVGSVAFPNQIVDYTYGREHTFFGAEHRQVTHVDFSDPYCESLRQALIAGAAQTSLSVPAQITYAATQGPRFETAAEIVRLERDGAHVVGMTGMPEAGLARELGLCYAAIAVIVNPAAGKSTGEISLEEIEQNLGIGVTKVRTLFEQVIPMIVEA